MRLMAALFGAAGGSQNCGKAMQIVRSKTTVVNEVNHCYVADTVEMGVWGKQTAGLRENDLPTNSNV